MSMWSEGDLPLVPDFTEPLRLYRTWNYQTQRVKDDETGIDFLKGLFSSSREYTWTPGEQTAACERIPLYTKAEPHESPDAACHCGFYGYHLPVQGNEFASIGTFVGVIEGYGKVVPHLLGARVGKARIIAITAHEQWTTVRDEAGAFLKEYFKDSCVDTDCGTTAELYEKYQPKDVSAIIGMTAQDAAAKYRGAGEYGFLVPPGMSPALRWGNQYVQQMYRQPPPASYYASSSPSMLKCNCPLCTGQWAATIPGGSNLNP